MVARCAPSAPKTAIVCWYIMFWAKTWPWPDATTDLDDRSPVSRRIRTSLVSADGPGLPWVAAGDGVGVVGLATALVAVGLGERSATGWAWSEVAVDPAVCTVCAVGAAVSGPPDRWLTPTAPRPRVAASPAAATRRRRTKTGSCLTITVSIPPDARHGPSPLPAPGTLDAAARGAGEAHRGWRDLWGW